MMSARTWLIIAALAAPAVAGAQTRTQPRPAARPQPAPPRQGVGVRGYATFGSLTLAAQETFDAVAEKHSTPIFGGGAQITGIWKGLFADVGFSQAKLDGERVFVDDGEVFRLGIPLEVTMRPLDVAGGWRFRFAGGRVSPYAGAGISFLTYKETSDFAESGDDVDESKTGPFVIGGVDVQVWRWISAGGEVRWRRVKGILGEGGASAEFDEDDAGGVSAAVRISIGR